MTGNQMLVPLGREKAVMLSVSIGAVFDFVLNFFVIPKMGAAGAALSTLLTEFLVLVVQTFFLKDHLGKVIRGVKALPILFKCCRIHGCRNRDTALYGCFKLIFTACHRCGFVLWNLFCSASDFKGKVPYGKPYACT